MSYTVITPEDLGNGLKVENQKVVVDVAALNIPVDVKLSGVNVDKTAQTMEFTLSDGTKITTAIADFLAVDTDTKIVSGSYADSKITLVDSENNNIEIDLAALSAQFAGAVKVVADEVSAVKATADSAKTASDANTAKVAELETKVQSLESAKLTATKVQSLGGVDLGYLVDASHVQTP